VTVHRQHKTRTPFPSLAVRPNPNGPGNLVEVEVEPGDEELVAIAVQRVTACRDELRGEESQQARRNMLTQLLSHGVELVEPASLDQARRQAAVRITLLQTPVYTYETLREVRGDSNASATRTAMSRARAAGKVFTVTHDANTLLPAFQFDDTGHPRPELADLIRPLTEAGMGPWQLWAWLTQRAALLSGLVPEQAAGDPETAARAAQAARRMAARIAPAATSA